MGEPQAVPRQLHHGTTAAAGKHLLDLGGPWPRCVADGPPLRCVRQEEESLGITRIPLVQLGKGEAWYSLLRLTRAGSGSKSRPPRLAMSIRISSGAPEEEEEAEGSSSLAPATTLPCQLRLSLDDMLPPEAHITRDLGLW